MMNIVAPGPDIDVPPLPAPKTSAELWWDGLYKSADDFSIRYGDRYRSSYVLIAMLAFFALAMAALGGALPQERRKARRRNGNPCAHLYRAAVDWQSFAPLARALDFIPAARRIVPQAICALVDWPFAPGHRSDAHVARRHRGGVKAGRQDRSAARSLGGLVFRGDDARGALCRGKYCGGQERCADHGARAHGGADRLSSQPPASQQGGEPGHRQDRRIVFLSHAYRRRREARFAIWFRGTTATADRFRRRRARCSPPPPAPLSACAPIRSFRCWCASRRICCA